MSLLESLSEQGSVASWSNPPDLDDERSMSSTGTPGTTTWMPDTPIMGGIIQVGKEEHSPWTGGLPKADWSGLDSIAPTAPVTPNQLRPATITASQAGHNFRQRGLATKFKRSGGDLATFEYQVWNHLCDTGLDTIAYVPDPVVPTKMVNVVKEHDRFSIESVS